MSFLLFFSSDFVYHTLIRNRQELNNISWALDFQQWFGCQTLHFWKQIQNVAMNSRYSEGNQYPNLFIANFSTKRNIKFKENSHRLSNIRLMHLSGIMVQDR